MENIDIVGSLGAGKTTLPRELMEEQQPRPEQENDQSSEKLRERLQNCIPDDPKSCLFTLVAVVCLVVGVIQFSHTGDTSMLATLLASVGMYVGLPKVKATLGSWRKERKY